MFGLGSRWYGVAEMEEEDELSYIVRECVSTGIL